MYEQKAAATVIHNNLTDCGTFRFWHTKSLLPSLFFPLDVGTLNPATGPSHFSVPVFLTKCYTASITGTVLPITAPQAGPGGALPPNAVTQTRFQQYKMSEKLGWKMAQFCLSHFKSSYGIVCHCCIGSTVHG